MLEVLNGHHERMHLCLEFHRELCSEKLPQTGRIALWRLRITAAAAERSRFLAKEILPILQGSSFPDIERLIDFMVGRRKLRHILIDGIWKRLSETGPLIKRLQDGP